jgi:hypothetical protein
MAAQYPRVRARLVALLPSLSGWSGVAVYDGQADTGDTPLAFAEVGFVDGSDEGGAGSVLALDGYRYVETGDVNLTVTCITGDDDPTGPQAQAFALFDALDAYVRTDRTLGVLPSDGTTSLSYRVAPTVNANGRRAALAVTVSYQATTT